MSQGNPFSLEGKRILVTGASSGIGRSVARALSLLGARLVLVARNRERLLETLEQLAPGEHAVLELDLTQEESLVTRLREVAAAGKLDGLVHCAGVHATVPLKALSLSKWDELLRVNLTAAMALTQGFRHAQVSNAGGSVVLVGSVMSLVGQAGSVAYCASKAGLVGLTKAAALELAKEKKRINLVCPGMVKTEMQDRFSSLVGDDGLQKVEDMHPLGLGGAEDVAYGVAYLLSDAAKWVTGSTLVIDGGYTVA